MSQPLYDMDQLMDFLNRVGKIPIPFILGVMPLQSHKHTEFLHNELPGVTIPDAVRERMRLAGERGIQEGILQAQEFLSAAQHHVDGVYFMPSFGRYEMVAELVNVLAREPAWRRNLVVVRLSGRVARVAQIAVASFLLTACGGAPTATPSAPPPSPQAQVAPSPVATVLVSSSPAPSPPAAASPAPSPTEETGPPPLQRLRVGNTGGAGANLRAEPSVQGERIELVPEGTLVDLVDPGRDISGTTWREVEQNLGPPVGSRPSFSHR